MSAKFQINSGSESQRLGILLDVGELFYVTNTKKFYVGDGLTYGGHEIDAVSAQTATNAEKLGGIDAAEYIVYSAQGTLSVDYANTADLATNADKLTTERTISISGDATGSVMFDGSADADIVLDVTSSNYATSAGSATNADNADKLSNYSLNSLAKASYNAIINPFSSQIVINQRGYVSGSTLANGAYGYDRWKASGGSAVITYSDGYYVLTSGTIEQVIETPALAGQTLTLSADTGGTTVNCVVDGKSGTLPFTVTITGTGSISVKLTGGKVRNVKLGYNDIYVPIDPATELVKCQRFYEKTSYVFVLGQTYTTAHIRVPYVPFKVSKCSIPTITLNNAQFGEDTIYTNFDNTGTTSWYPTQDGFRFVIVSSGLTEGNIYAAYFDFEAVSEL